LAAAAVMRASHRATRVTAALAAALTSLLREIRDTNLASKKTEWSPQMKIPKIPSTCKNLGKSPTTSEYRAP